MKILMTTMKLDIGGAETHIVEVARELVRRGCEVTVCSNGGVYVPVLEAAGIRHIKAPLHSKRPDRVLSAYRILDRLLGEEHFDILHAHARIPAFLCGILARKHHIRFVTTAHLTFEVNALWRRISSWGERSLAVSDDIKAYLIKEYGMSPDNIGVTVNGIDTVNYSGELDSAPVREELALSPEHRVIVSVSRLDTDRSLASLLLCAIAPRIHAQFPNARFLIVGGGTDEKRVTEAMRRANSAAGENIVLMTGARTDINRLISAGDICIGVSRAALEAMAMEKPVILCGNEGYGGIFRESILSLVMRSNFCCRGCPASAEETLYTDVYDLLRASPEELRALGAFGRDTVLTYYSVSRMADDYLSMYESVRPYEAYKNGDILMCGYYGFGNMGDDSLLRAITDNLHRVSPDCRITVMTKTPKETHRDFGVNTVHRFHPFAVMHAMKHAKLLIFGGGSLLQDGSSKRSLLYYVWILRLAHLFGMKIMVYANGIGPLGSKSSRRLAKKALSYADYLSLREENSLRLVKEMGLSPEKCTLTADPAFTLFEHSPSWIDYRLRSLGLSPEKKYFIVALREWKQNSEQNRIAVAAAIDRISEQYGFLPVFLPMHEALDTQVSTDVANLCKCKTAMLTGLTGSELLGILRRQEFVIAMRLHTLIYSTAVGCASMALAYDEKLESFMDSMSLPYLVREVDTDEIVACASRLLHDRPIISEHLSAVRGEMVALAGNDATEAIRLCEEEEQTK